MSFHLVRGHQDRNKNLEELSVKAQLNVCADKLTGRIFLVEFHRWNIFIIPPKRQSSKNKNSDPPRKFRPTNLSK